MKRTTRQGEIILKVIRSARRPLTPLEIHQRATRKSPTIGIATTYRHLKSLSENQQVVGVDYPGQPPRYEWVDGKNKVHFACRSCDKLFALEDTTGDTPPANAPEGFEVQGFEVMLYGLCPACRKA
jgi:Fur family ferric uptake transcriptional regulator